jgi:hypothetical protein
MNPTQSIVTWGVLNLASFADFPDPSTRLSRALNRVAC